MNVGIVGAGIVGLAHAWSAAKRGHRVTVFERSAKAAGASIRNFGMIWPIGQTPGQWYAIALRSRQLWLEAARSAGIWIAPCGSIHLAHRPDEWEVLQEFASQAAELGWTCQLLSATGVAEKSAAALTRGLLGGLYSDAECCVNPVTATRRLADWLAEQMGVRFAFETMVVGCESGRILAKGRHASSSDATFDRIVVCSGSDIGTLYPDAFSDAGLRLCKLQMLSTACQPNNWRLGPHLASGLTLRHYPCFQSCTSLPTLRRRIADETPELDRYGIHVMASQNDLGQVVLGDSHEYDAEIEPFDKQLIDQLILRELRKIMTLPDWTIEQRWHGLYCKHAHGPMLALEPERGVSLRSGTGGSGMTMAFGLAELDWDQWT